MEDTCLVVSVNPTNHKRVRTYDLAYVQDQHRFNQDIWTHPELLFMDMDEYLSQRFMLEKSNTSLKVVK